MIWWKVALLLHLAFLNKCGKSDFHLCVNIAWRVLRPIGGGKSTYARRRRAASIGRCYRCYRLSPPLPQTTRCDGVTCVPGISYNMKVARYIRDGVTEVIPSTPCYGGSSR
ncbi:nucleic acid binding protein [Yam latent virus]|uniref:RNA silencing suppressor n=1 Tax=Yam latent virus TaxID=1592930 RepID=A0A0B4VMU0_9VIRU|nr:nucleic acid binding protein [Yam latent virus]AJD23370.1 nucleic acid binding protein [Yam latent virus]